jgi:hypothetical protein
MPKYFAERHMLEDPEPVFPLNVRDHVLHPYNTEGKLKISQVEVYLNRYSCDGRTVVLFTCHPLYSAPGTAKPAP